MKKTRCFSVLPGRLRLLRIGLGSAAFLSGALLLADVLVNAGGGSSNADKTGNGGGILDYGQVTFSGSASYENNTVRGFSQGGAVYAGSVVQQAAVSFTGNRAEGGSGGALGLALADEVWMLETAVYSVISPEGCASILWKDSTKMAEAAECLKLTAQDLFKMQVIERIIREPKTKDSKMFESLKGLILRTFEKYRQMDADELLRQRYERFRKFGNNTEPFDFVEPQPEQAL